jgi:hypothetical protein
MPSAIFEPVIPATKRQQTYALGRAATRIGKMLNLRASNLVDTIYLKIQLYSSVSLYEYPKGKYEETTGN